MVRLASSIVCGVIQDTRCIRAINTFIRHLGISDEKIIHRTLTNICIQRVIDIFIAIRCHHEIAIFICCGEIYIRTVFITCLIQKCKPRNALHQFGKLFKEGTIPINGSSKIQSVPAIGPPFFVFIDFKWLIRRIDRNNIFTRKIRFSFIKKVLVSESAPTL